MNEIDKQDMVWDTVMEEIAVWDFQDWLHPRLGLSKTEHAEKRESALVCCPVCFEPVKTSELQCSGCGF